MDTDWFVKEIHCTRLSNPGKQKIKNPESEAKTKLLCLMAWSVLQVADWVNSGS